MTIVALDIQLSEDNGPVNPAQRFAAGFPRIYFFVNYSGLQTGVYWRRELWMDGKLTHSNQYLWGSDSQGETFFFFGVQGGFKPGNYEIRLYVGEGSRPISAATFTVTGP